MNPNIMQEVKAKMMNLPKLIILASLPLLIVFGSIFFLATPAGALGDPQIATQIISNPGTNWSPSLPSITSSTSVAAQLLKNDTSSGYQGAIQSWKSTQGTTLLIELVQGTLTTKTLPTLESSTINVICTSPSSPALSVPGIPDGLSATCTEESAFGAIPINMVMGSQGNTFFIVIGIGKHLDNSVGVLTPVAIAQYQAIPQPLLTPLHEAIIGAALFVIVIIFLLILLKVSKKKKKALLLSQRQFESDSLIGELGFSHSTGESYAYVAGPAPGEGPYPDFNNPDAHKEKEPASLPSFYQPAPESDLMSANSPTGMPLTLQLSSQPTLVPPTAASPVSAPYTQMGTNEVPLTAPLSISSVPPPPASPLAAPLSASSAPSVEPEVAILGIPDMPPPPPSPLAAPPPPPPPAAIAIPSIPVGWHPDETNREIQRYWDGSAWTRQMHWDGTNWIPFS